LAQFAVQTRYGSLPDPLDLAADLRRAALGQLPERLARQVAAGRKADVAARGMWDHDGATDADVLELRAADPAGRLFRGDRVLEEAGADVRAARISTLGGDVVDAFYLTGTWSDPTVRAEVAAAVLEALG